MSGEQQPATPAKEETPDASASFMAGFDQDDNAEQPTETPAAAVTPEPAPADPPAPKYVQITEDDWNSLQSRAAKIDEISTTLDKRFDQVVGTMGRTLERKLAELQKATPTGEAVQVDGADFKELAEEFPEVGALTLKGFNNALARIKGTGSDPAAIEKAVTPLRDDMLEIAFPGWQDDVKTPDFAAWRKTQGPEVEALAASDRQRDAAKLLRMFYARTKTEAQPAAAPAPAAKPAAPAAPAQPSMRSRQIAAAVAPRGDSAAPPSNSGKTPFMAGFESDD